MCKHHILSQFIFHTNFMVNLGKRTSPMIGKLSELLVSGHRTGFLDVNTSPRSPLDLKMQSPKGLKKYDFGVVGLGIVAALEKSGDYNNSFGRDVLAKCVIANSSPIQSNPIPVNSVRTGDRFSSAAPRRGCEYQEYDDDEDYTFVTRHGPNNEVLIKVYYDGGDIGRSRRSSQQRNDFVGSNNLGIFNVSTPSYREEPCVKPTLDFLSSCNLCKKKLHGKDIYMYRGEKAFCSSECRSSQIMMDERKEQCRSEASKSLVDVSGSSYSRGQIFSTGIVAI